MTASFATEARGISAAEPPASAAPTGLPSFDAIIKALRARYGKPPAPISRDPFHLILHQQVAYLVPASQRDAAFSRLRKEIGLTPARISAASKPKLTAIARAGGTIAAGVRAERMQKSAAIVEKQWQGDLRRALKLPLVEARRALAAFPMIGPPGAERILALTGAHAVLGLDSNGLRVCLRLGWGKEQKNYAASYRGVIDALATELPTKPLACADAASLLREHGETLCRRARPICADCPLATLCAFARAQTPS